MNTFQKALLVVGALGLGSSVAAPAFAGNGGQAYVSGSSAIVLMNGASQSVGAELSAPNGTFFLGTGGIIGTPSTTPGAITVTPSLEIPGTATSGTADGLATNGNNIKDLVVDAGAIDSVTTLNTGASVSFTAAAAAALDLASDSANGGTAFNLEEVVSIIRAGAGINGLD